MRVETVAAGHVQEEPKRGNRDEYGRAQGAVSLFINAMGVSPKNYTKYVWRKRQWQ